MGANLMVGVLKQVTHNKSVNLTPGGAGYPSVMFRVRLKD